MARPMQEGVDYFPLNVDFFEDEKVEAISGEFKSAGDATLVRLLCLIYRNGYYVRWTEMLQMQLLRRVPELTPELLQRIIERTLQWNIFSATMFRQHGILTSRGIQRRYLEITKRRKSPVEPTYLIDDKVTEKDLEMINVCNNPVSKMVNVCNNPIKESKVKESKVNNSCCCLENSSEGSGANASAGWSFYAQTKEEQEQQQQQIFEIFFFRNFVNVSYEVNRFISTNERHLWMNKSKSECYSRLEQREALARMWSPETKRQRIATPGFLAMWERLREMALEEGRDDVASRMLDERVTLGMTANKQKFIVCHQCIWDWMTAAERAKFTRSVLDTVFPNEKINIKPII